jgi:hypothetical protein
MFKYKIVAETGFHDLNRYPRKISVGEVVVVDEAQYRQMKASDPDSIQLVEKLAPNPKPSKEFLERVKGKSKDAE